MSNSRYSISGVLSRMLVALTVLYLLVPMIITISVSFDTRANFAVFPPEGFTLAWFQKFLNFQPFVYGFTTSIVLALVATSLSIATSLPAALVLSRKKFRGREALNTFLLSPILVPGLISGVSLLFFLSRIGLVSNFSQLIIGHWIITFPFMVRALIATMTGFEKNLTDAAASLGASSLYTFRRITLPLARPGFVAGAIFAFVISFYNVDISVFLTSGSTTTLPVSMLFAMFEKPFSPDLAAGSVLLLGATFILILILDRFVGLDAVVGTRIVS